MMLAKLVIPRQYWLMATDAAYRHECIAGKQLPKARKPMPKAKQDELKAILEQEEDEFEPIEAVMQVEEPGCEKCNAPKLDQQTETEPDVKPVMEDVGVQTMGEIPPETLVPGTKYKKQVLMMKNEA